MDIKLLGARIKYARESRELSIEDVAKEISVNKSTVSRYERGEIERPKIPVINALAEVLCVNPSWLIGKDTNKTYTPKGMDLSYYNPCNLFSTLPEIRKEFGYTTNDVAFKIGISEADYIAIENGRDTSCTILSRLAVLFCCSPNHLLSIDGVFGEDRPSQEAMLSVLPASVASDYHVLSSDEADLIRIYRDLNSTGQETAKVVLQGLLPLHPGEESNIAAKEA